MKYFGIACLLFLFVFSSRAQCYDQYYKTGDVLYVVAMNGLNLRDAPEEKGKALCKLEPGDTVFILDAFNYKLNTDTIFGFCGSWVKVKSLSRNIEGYVFDAFISHYPILKDENLQSKIQHNRDGYTFYLPGNLLKEYVFQVFDSTGCNSYYDNGSDGEGWHSMNIIGLEKNNQFVDHGYWESGGMELMLFHARKSEMYYLVLHLLKNLPDSLYKVNDKGLRLCLNYERDYENCPISTKYKCLFSILCKGNYRSIYLDDGLTGEIH